MSNLLRTFLEKEEKINKWFNLEELWDLKTSDPERIVQIVEGLLNIQTIIDDELDIADFSLESKYLNDIKLVTAFDFGLTIRGLREICGKEFPIPTTHREFQKFRKDIVETLYNRPIRRKI